MDSSQTLLVEGPRNSLKSCTTSLNSLLKSQIPADFEIWNLKFAVNFHSFTVNLLQNMQSWTLCHATLYGFWVYTVHLWIFKIMWSNILKNWWHWNLKSHLKTFEILEKVESLNLVQDFLESWAPRCWLWQVGKKQAMNLESCCIICKP